jgi:hypothetical protein
MGRESNIDRPTQSLGRPLDLTIVFDTTSSMSDKVTALLEACRKLAEELTAQKLNYRAALISFGNLEVGDKIKATDYTGNIQVFRQMVSNIPRTVGAGTIARYGGESSLEAIHKGVVNTKRSGRPGALRVFILITDAAAMHAEMAGKVIAELLAEEIMIFCVAPPLPYFQKMAKVTGGEWIQISRDASLGDIARQLLVIVSRISQVVAQVCDPKLGAGSVKRYLALKASNGE